MLASIIKRDGTEVAFDSVKILNAITKANKASGEDMSPTDLLFVTEKVCRKLEAQNLRHVEEIQDVVEETLIQYDYAKTAKAYILYRAEHTKRRNAESYLMEIYKTLTYAPAIEEDIKRENANIDGDTAMGTMLKYGSEGAKYFTDNYVLPKDASAAHINGDIHIHDKDFYMLTETCCQIDLIHAVPQRVLHRSRPPAGAQFHRELFRPGLYRHPGQPERDARRPERAATSITPWPAAWPRPSARNTVRAWSPPSCACRTGMDADPRPKNVSQQILRGP